MAYVSNDDLFPVWREPRSFWERTGLTPEQRRRLDLALAALVVVLLAGWVYSAVHAIRTGDAPQIARRIGASPTPLARNSPPPAAFALDAALRRFVDFDDFQGESGAVRVVVQEPGDSLALPDSLPADVEVAYSTPGDTLGTAARPGASAPSEPGIWNLMLRVRGAIRTVPELNVVTLVPRSEVRGGRLGEYRLGSWPERTGVYEPPRGFVRVTPENMNTYVSEHIQLKDFLTKGQEGVWPKYVAMSTRLLDKLELTFQELERRGHPVDNVFIVSGFRNPWYNASGGNTAGRGALSRHMYGDAMDVTIDNDRNGRMDDLNGDGRVTVADARVLAQAAEAVERKYPHLIGGIGIYPPTGAHSGMVHIDTRGFRARW